MSGAAAVLSTVARSGAFRLTRAPPPKVYRRRCRSHTRTHAATPGKLRREAFKCQMFTSIIRGRGSAA